MRSNDERLQAVKKRASQLRRASAKKAAVAAVAACAAIIVGLSLAIPKVAAGFSEGGFEYSGLTASIFKSGSALGYILMGVLAFVLGVCVTILCYRLKGDSNGKGGSDDGAC